MRVKSHLILKTSGSFVVIGIVVAVGLLRSPGEGSRTAKALPIVCQKIGGAGNEVTVPSTNVFADFFRGKYSLEQRAGFHMTSSEPIAIFVLATGVQILTDTGWQKFSEEPRNEIWRLKPGTAQEMFVERPEKEREQAWRAYVRYGAEIQGWPLLKAQLQEAWKIRSFNNWTGKAWGGGRFRGSNEFFSAEFSE